MQSGVFRAETFQGPAGSRRYMLYVPKAYDASRPAPLVVMLHGCLQDASDIARGSRLNEHAERNGFLVVYPEQPESANPRKCWNWFDVAHQRRGSGEPAIIEGITRAVMRDHQVDARRVFVGGISAGAAMASLVAVAHPELYAAVALHSGVPYRAASNVMEGVGVMSNGAGDVVKLAELAHAEMGPRSRPIPAIIFQGGADAVVKPVNARHTLELWLAMNSLAVGRARSEPASQLVRSTEGEEGGYQFLRECYGGAATPGCVVESWTVKPLGHALSGGSSAGSFADTRGPDAAREMMRFFSEHPMPNAPAGQPPR